MSTQSEGFRKTDAELRLDKAVLALEKNPEAIEFFEAFMAEEEEHINKFLSKDDFNLRAAGMCAEAYATAQLMHNLITK